MEPTRTETPARRGRAMPQWLEMVVSLAALVTSVASIGMAMDNNNSMAKLVTANSWPFPTLSNSNVVEGESRIALAVRNSGSGPAKLETVVVRYKGKIITSAEDLARACCATPGATGEDLHKETGDMTTSTPSSSVLLPGDSVTMLSVPRNEANLPFWNKLNEARFQLTFEACYCSVFDDCWTTDLKTTHPKPVAQCKPSDQIYRG